MKMASPFDGNTYSENADSGYQPTPNPICICYALNKTSSMKVASSIDVNTCPDNANLYIS